MDTKSTKLIGALVAIVAIGGAAAWLLNRPEAAANPQTPDTAGTGSGDATAPNTRYRNGTYTAIGDYVSPAGAEQVEVTLTLSGDKIVDAIFVGKAENPGSKMLQEQFATGFKEQVIGKPIDELSLTVVNGSSLTPQGFMDAVAKIKTQAS